MSLDFHSAFDKISHNYLQDILRAHGFGNLFVDRIMGLYRNAASEILVNGFRSTPIPVRSSIRQGCPLSMQLYTLCLNPLLHILEEKLAGVRIGRGRSKTVTVAYADDVTVLLTRRLTCRNFKIRDTCMKKQREQELTHTNPGL